VINYLTDDSFFTFISPRFSGNYISPVRTWFWEALNASNRFIYNERVATTGLGLEGIEDLYPTVKTIQVVANPWLIWYDTYQRSLINKTSLFKFDSSRRASLSEFLASNINSKKKMPSQLSFAQYRRDGELHQSACIFRYENLHNEFKMIQNYFDDHHPLRIPLIPDYREAYTDEDRHLIARTYKEDIERFGYTF
jgi:hypothetical protein